MLTLAKSKYINATSVASANVVYTGIAHSRVSEKKFFFSPKLNKT